MVITYTQGGQTKTAANEAGVPVGGMVVSGSKNAPVSTSYTYVGSDGKSYNNKTQQEVQTTIPGVSSSVNSALNSIGYDATKANVDNKSISGSPSVTSGMATTTAMNGGIQAITGKAPTTYTPLQGTAQPTFGTQGPAVGSLQSQLNAKAQQLGINLPQLKLDNKYGPLTQQMEQAIKTAEAGGTASTAKINADGNTEHPNGLTIDPSGNIVKPSDASLQDPAVAQANLQATQATTNENSSYQSSVSLIQSQLKSAIDSNNADKETQLAAAKTTYLKDNPEGAGSDMNEYLSGIASKFDAQNETLTSNANADLTNLYQTHTSNLQNIQGQLQNAIQTSQANAQQMKKDASSMLNTSIDNFQKVITGNPDVAKLFNDAGEITGSYDKVQSFIQTATGMGVPQELAIPMLKSEVANAKAKQASIDAAATSSDLAQKRETLAERAANRADLSANRADAMLSIALNRDQRADETAARTQTKDIENQFTKTNTSSGSLATGQQYLARIEAASGEGVSALGLLDALVKLDTGGQAIREGQVNILEKSGTYSDTLNRFMSNFSGKPMGANTILTANQVEQIKTQAKKIAGEQIKVALPAYVQAKEGVDSVKNDYPSEAAKIDGYSSQLKSAETFIQKYGSEEDKQAAGLSSSTADTSTPPEIQAARTKYKY